MSKQQAICCGRCVPLAAFDNRKLYSKLLGVRLCGKKSAHIQVVASTCWLVVWTGARYLDVVVGPVCVRRRARRSVQLSEPGGSWRRETLIPWRVRLSTRPIKHALIIFARLRSSASPRASLAPTTTTRLLTRRIKLEKCAVVWTCRPKGLIHPNLANPLT